MAFPGAPACEVDADLVVDEALEVLAERVLVEASFSIESGGDAANQVEHQHSSRVVADTLSPLGSACKALLGAVLSYPRVTGAGQAASMSLRTRRPGRR